MEETELFSDVVVVGAGNAALTAALAAHEAGAQVRLPVVFSTTITPAAPVSCWAPFLGVLLEPGPQPMRLPARQEAMIGEERARYAEEPGQHRSPIFNRSCQVQRTTSSRSSAVSSVVVYTQVQSQRS